MEDEAEFTKVRFEGRHRRALSESEIAGSDSDSEAYAAADAGTERSESVASGQKSKVSFNCCLTSAIWGSSEWIWG